VLFNMPLPGKRKAIIILVIVAAAVLLRVPLKHLSFSIRLALSMQRLASGAAKQNLDVIETSAYRRDGTQDYEALCYRPAKSHATSALILVAGISELGCRHPMLVALARMLADKGLFVITPDIKELREFKISSKPIDQILFWHRQVSSMQGAERIRKIGFAGISFSATLALMAAARPEVRDTAGFAAGIGSYYNLARCAKGWFAAGSAAAENNRYPTRFYAKWIIMLAALDMVAASSDRIFLHEVLGNLLLERKVPPAGASLSVEGLRWYRMATMPAGQSDPDLALEIEDYLTSRIYSQLDPKDTLMQLRCPVFLIHGAYDDLIPPQESTELHQRVTHSYLLISPFLTHTHPSSASLSLGQKIRAAFDTLVFCYRFSRAIA
jgi:pimeloyl-ACP methyl ester carboxylesterase